MRKIALIVVVLLLAIAVVPAFANDDTVSGGPLHCALESPLGEQHGARNSGGQGAGGEDGNAGGRPAGNPPPDQAGVGSHTGDGKSNENGKVCTPLRE